MNHLIRDHSLPTGVAFIFVDENGENSIAVAPGANANLSARDIESAKNIIHAADIVLMQLETPIETIEKAAAIASANQVPVILNPAPAQKLNDKLLKNITILTPNETELEILTGIPINNHEQNAAESAKILLKKGIHAVLVTMGAKGALAVKPDSIELISSFKVNAVDTTAAGDVFNGTLAVAIAEKQPLKKAIKFANAAAALSVTKLGAQPSIPYRNEINMFLQNTPSD